MKSNSFLKNQIQKLVNSKDLKKLFANFLSLVVLQALNVILPLLTVPFLIKTVGLEKFGLLSFVYSFAYFFQIVVEYGFNTISARDVSIHQNDTKKLNQIFSEVLNTKLILLVLSFIVYVLVIFTVPKLKDFWLLYLLQFGCVFGQAIFPIWFFQGVQKMKYITFLNVFFKSVFTLCIFIFVEDDLDIWMVPLFNSLGFIFCGISALLIITYHFKMQITKVKFNAINNQLKNGLYLFLSELQMALIVNANTLILGFFAGDKAVGIYTTAEKIVRAVGNLQAPVINALFPFISKNMKEDSIRTLGYLYKIKKVGLPLILILSILFFIFAPNIFMFVFKEPLLESVIVFRILIFFPLFSFLDQFYGKLILLTNNLENKFFKVFYQTSMLSLVLNVILTYLFSYTGTAIANSIVQFFVFLGMYLYAKPIMKNDEKY